MLTSEPNQVTGQRVPLHIRVGTPNKIIGGQPVHPGPPFFGNLQLKVTFQHRRKFPSFAPDPIVHFVHLFFRKIHVAKSYTLSLIVLIAFHQFLLPQLKSRSILASPTE